MYFKMGIGLLLLAASTSAWAASSAELQQAYKQYEVLRGQRDNRWIALQAYRVGDTYKAANYNDAKKRLERIDQEMKSLADVLNFPREDAAYVDYKIRALKFVNDRITALNNDFNKNLGSDHDFYPKGTIRDENGIWEITDRGYRQILDSKGQKPSAESKVRLAKVGFGEAPANTTQALNSNDAPAISDGDFAYKRGSDGELERDHTWQKYNDGWIHN